MRPAYQVVAAQSSHEEWRCLVPKAVAAKEIDFCISCRVQSLLAQEELA